MKRLYALCLCILIITAIVGCSKKETDSDKMKDIEFTVVDDINIPDELKSIIDGKKTDAFQMTFTAGESMYLAIGYGEQKTGGFSIKVDGLYMAKDGIHIITNLLGPDKEEKVSKKASYPYIVVKIKTIEAEVIYE